MNKNDTLTEEEILENIDFLRYDDEFIESADFYLARAAEKLNVSMMKLFLSLGANPNATGWGDVESLLHGLVHSYGSVRLLNGERVMEAVELLLQSGADPNLAGSNNLTPMQVAQSIKADALVELLTKYGGDPEGNPVI